MHAVRDEAISLLGSVLVERGWVWWRDVGHETPSLVLGKGDGIVNVLGLVTQTFPNGEVSLSPTLGVAHLEVGRLAAAFNNRPWRGAGDSSLFGTSLSTAMQAAGISASPYSRWGIDAQTRVQRVVDTLVEDIDIHGMSFWNRFRDLNDMILWMRGDKSYQAIVGHLAIALALVGQRRDAVDALEAYVAFTVQRGGRMHQRTQSFVLAFSSHFGFGVEATEA